MAETYNTEGFIFLPEEIEKIVAALPEGIFGNAAPFLTGSGEGKTICLHDNFKKAKLDFPVLNQGNIGTCTSFAIAGATDLLKVTEMANGEREIFNNITATEPIYYGARKLSNWRIRGDGASVALGVKYISESGTIARGKYGNIDISEYSVDRARKWGQNSGFPKTIEDISKEYPITKYAKVVSYEQCRDAVANGYPVVVGSGVGFTNVTDNDGFCKESGGWNHCYHPNSWIIGPDIKRLKFISAGDFVYNHLGKIATVERVEKRIYNDKLFYIKCRSGEHYVTKDHVFLVKSTGHTVIHRPYIPYKLGKEYSDVKVSINLAVLDTEKANELIWVKACDLLKSDQLVMPRIKFDNILNIPNFEESSKATNKPNKLTPTKDLAWFFGMYVGDGYSVKDHKIVIIQNSKDVKKINRLIVFIKNELKLTPFIKKRKDVNAIDITIYSSVLANFMFKWFNMKTNKQLPNWLMSNAWDLHSLLEGFGDSDGCWIRAKKAKRCQFSNTSEKLINQMHLIMLNLNMDPSRWVSINKNSSYGSTLPNYFLLNNFNKIKNDNLIYSKIKSIEEIDYNGEVISLKVTDEHSYVCNMTASHNCMYFAAIRSDRPGCLCVNSWGKNWLKITKRNLNQPDGSFWVDAKTVNKMMSTGDAWALAGIDGYKLKVDSKVWT